MSALPNLEKLSKANWLALQPQEVQDQFLNSLTPEELLALDYCWDFWGRPEQQLPPGDWRYWLILAGRGSGKTRTGTETIFQWLDQGFERINLAARTSGDIRKTMIYGESGLIAKAPPHLKPEYKVSLKELHWPDGRISNCYSADEPEQGRGANSEKIWADELGAWPSDELWINLTMGLRIGRMPQAIITTTGRRRSLLRKLMKAKNAVVTRGHTLDNRAHLHESFIQDMIDQFEGTELGRQELAGDVLDDGGAYWNLDVIQDLRIVDPDKLPRMTRVVIGVDPAVTFTKRSDAHGIVVVGLGTDGHLYVLADLSRKAGPEEWADIVLEAYVKYNADLIIAETNRGGDLIESNLRAAAKGRSVVPNILPLNTQEGKSGRAEPVSTIYAKKRAHHVGVHRELEDEMCDWDPTLSRYSPNRIDALCFAASELIPNLPPVSSVTSSHKAAPKDHYAPNKPSAWDRARGRKQRFEYVRTDSGLYVPERLAA